MKIKEVAKVNKIFLFVLGIILFVSFLFTFYFAHETWIESKKSAYHSCIASISIDLSEKISSSSKGKNVIFNALSNEEKTKLISQLSNDKDWLILSKEETQKLISQVTPKDCYRFENPAIDLWDNVLQIAYRIHQDEVELLIWSKGYDGISGTTDDILIP